MIGDWLFAGFWETKASLVFALGLIYSKLYLLRVIYDSRMVTGIQPRIWDVGDCFSCCGGLKCSLGINHLGGV
jgi:hypothetical protein